MKKSTWLVLISGVAAAAICAACSSSSGSPGGTAGGSTTSCSGATPAALTVKNVDIWCTVSVNGGTPSPAEVQTVCVADGTVSLSATANSGFVLGDWHHTSGDTGSGDPGTVSGGTSTAKVAVSGSSACVWVCCPGSSGDPACPTTDACE